MSKSYKDVLYYSPKLNDIILMRMYVSGRIKQLGNDYSNDGVMYPNVWECWVKYLKYVEVGEL